MGTTVTLSFPSHIDVGISQVIMDDEYWQHHIFLQGGTFPADMEKLYNYPFAFYTGVSRENLHPLELIADVLNKLTQHPAIYSLGVAGEETIHPLYIAVPIEGNLLSRSHVWRR